MIPDKTEKRVDFEIIKGDLKERDVHPYTVRRPVQGREDAQFQNWASGGLVRVRFKNGLTKEEKN